jgi:hypothetical protein
MSDNKNKPAEKSQPKEKYDFGTIDKAVLETSDLEVSVFALAHAMPGGDGRDPTRLPVMT